MREAASDVAGLIEPGQRVRRQVDVQASEVVGELLGGPVAGNLWKSLVWLAAIFIVFVPLSVRAYKRAA